MENKFECQKCFKCFSKEIYLKRHYKNKTDCSKKVEYQCLKCQKKFKDKTKYQVHINTLKCKMVECVSVSTQTNLEILDKTLEKKIEKLNDVIKNFVPVYLQNFMTFIYFNLDVDKINNVDFEVDNDNLLLKNVIIFLNGLNDSLLHDLYSTIIKKSKNLDAKKIYLFYIIVKKNLKFFKNKEQINLWNSRLYQEINQGKTNSGIQIQFE